MEVTSTGILWYNREIEKWCDNDTDKPIEKCYVVTAWMPLPESYQQKGV